MGLIKLLLNKKRQDDWDKQRRVMEFFENQCSNEYIELYTSATSEEKIDLYLSKYEDYKNWRWVNPRANPHDYYKRPNAPDIAKFKSQFAEIANSAYEAYNLSKKLGREEEFYNLFKTKQK